MKKLLFFFLILQYNIYAQAPMPFASPIQVKLKNPGIYYFGIETTNHDTFSHGIGVTGVYTIKNTLNDICFNYSGGIIKCVSTLGVGATYSAGTGLILTSNTFASKFWAESGTAVTLNSSYYSLGLGATTNQSKFVVVGNKANCTQLAAIGFNPMFNFVNSNANINRSTLAQVTDTSSFGYGTTYYTYKPYLSIKGITGNTIMGIDTAGNMGINTPTNPNHTCDILGATSNAVRIKGSPGSGWILGSYDANNAAIWSTLSTPSITNYCLVASANLTDLGSSSVISFSIAGAEKARFNTTTFSMLVSSQTISGQSAASISVSRNTTAATAGTGFTISGGGCKSGGLNLGSTPLTIQAPITTGRAKTSIRIQARSATWANSTSDNVLYDRMIIGGMERLRDNVADTLFSVVLGADSIYTAILSYGLNIRGTDTIQSETGFYFIHIRRIKNGGTYSGEITSSLNTRYLESGSLNFTGTIIAGATSYITVKYDTYIAAPNGSMKLNWNMLQSSGQGTSITQY